MLNVIWRLFIDFQMEELEQESFGEISRHLDGLKLFQKDICGFDISPFWKYFYAFLVKNDKKNF